MCRFWYFTMLLRDIKVTQSTEPCNILFILHVVCKLILSAIFLCNHSQLPFQQKYAKGLLFLKQRTIKNWHIFVKHDSGDPPPQSMHVDILREPVGSKSDCLALLISVK